MDQPTDTRMADHPEYGGMVYRVYSGTMIVTIYWYTGIQVWMVYR